jgi:bifunctional non-homologous end joining protein LigD
VTEGRASDPLETFRDKRDFSLTPEPSGMPRRAGRRGAPRFVIHEHSARRMHWDLRLERDGVLASWALPRGLPLEPKVNHIAPHTEDHPLEYLEFEGVIPAGSYGAGTIRIWDRGTYECLKWEERKIEVALHGERVNARFALFAIGKDGESRDWMIHRMDAADDPGRQPMPERVAPMLARAASLPVEGDWAYELKWDGVRAIAYCVPGNVRLQSRNLGDITASYPELARLTRALSTHEVVLDGEIVVLGEDGRPSFGALQPRMHVSSPARAKRLAEQSPVTYVIFDLLWLDGHSLLERPYHERRAALEGLGLDGEHWRVPAAVVGHGAEVLAASREQQLEGVVAKRRDSRYEPGRRSGAWTKVRNITRQELVVGGWTSGQGRRADQIGALLVGVSDGAGGLRYCGRVGSGLGERELELLVRRLAPIAREDSPFTAGAAPPRGAHFCEPQIVVEVAFSEWTRDGLLRQPSFLGIRDDIAADAVVREPVGFAIEERGARRARASADGRELSLSNLDKVLYPQSGFTKEAVIDYYAALAPVLLPHLMGRALTVTRYPDGVDGKAFFEKQSPSHRPDWVQTTPVPSERRRTIDFTLADDLPTLIWLANLAALELHVPLHRAASPERPDAVVFDLDPGPPATILECCRVALWLAGAFERLGLASVPKTSGSKGLQVYVPLGGTADYAATKSFALALAQLVEQAEPALAVSRMTRSIRAGKVLIDWSQNDQHKTTICAYSLRARERPTVSTPLEWDEVRGALDGGDPDALAFDADAVRARVADRGDLFADVVSLTQKLPAI